MKISSKHEAVFLREFIRNRYRLGVNRIDFDAAAAFFGVAPTSIRRWMKEQPPQMAIRLAQMAARSIPDTDDWAGFRFGQDGRLHSPVDRMSFSGSELNFQFYERQFARMDRTTRAALEKQLAAVRSEEERKAIIEELEDVMRVLRKLQGTALLSPAGKVIPH